MTHLSASEFVDFVDGTLETRRAAHLDVCIACRDRANSVRDAKREASVVDMPDPSPSASGLPRLQSVLGTARSQPPVVEVVATVHD